MICTKCKKEYPVLYNSWTKEWGKEQSICSHCIKGKSEEDQIHLIKTITKLSQEAGFLRGILDALLLQLTYHEVFSYYSISSEVIDKIKESLNKLDENENNN